KLEEAAWLEDSERLPQGPVGLGNVHEAHERHGEVELLVGEGKGERTRLPVVDGERLALLLFTGKADERRGDVHRRHSGPPLGQEPGAVPLATTDVQPGEAGYFGKQGQEGGHGDLVPADVVTAAGELGPRLGVAVPKRTDLLIVHSSLRR